jgi:hypothetical protein
MSEVRDILGNAITPGVPVVCAMTRRHSSLQRGLVLALEGNAVWIRALHPTCPTAPARTICIAPPGRVLVVENALSDAERAQLARHRFRRVQRRPRLTAYEAREWLRRQLSMLTDDTNRETA